MMQGHLAKRVLGLSLGVLLGVVFCTAPGLAENPEFKANRTTPGGKVNKLTFGPHVPEDTALKVSLYAFNMGFANTWCQLGPDRLRPQVVGDLTHAAVPKDEADKTLAQYDMLYEHGQTEAKQHKRACTPLDKQEAKTLMDAFISEPAPKPAAKSLGAKTNKLTLKSHDPLHPRQALAMKKPSAPITGNSDMTAVNYHHVNRVAPMME